MNEKNNKKTTPDITDINANRQPCEIFSRIVGYIRPVANWHIGKQEEWKDRVTYSVKKSLSHI